MLDDNFGGLDSYKVTEQKMLNNSDRIQHTSNTKKSLSGKQFRCMGQPVETGRAVVGFIVLLIGAIILLVVKDELVKTELGCLICMAACIGTLVSSFAIMLGGKK